MPVTVSYNNTTPWGSYSPYVTFDHSPMYFGEFWCNVINIQLEGSLSGNLLSTSIDSAAATIQSVFASDQGEIKIIDSAGSTIKYGLGTSASPGTVFIDSVSFPNQNSFTGGANKVLKFNVSLRVYDFGDMPCILDPSDSIDIQESSNLTATVTHTISAKGVNKGPALDGMQSAVSWVQTRLGLFKPSNATFVGTTGPIGLGTYAWITIDQTEELNTLTDTFSITTKYLVDYVQPSPPSPNSVNTPFVRYTVNLNSGLHQDYDTVSVSAEVKGGKENTIAELRAVLGVKESYLRSQALTAINNGSMKQIGTNHAWALTDVICDSYTLDEDLNTKSLKAKATFSTRGITSQNLDNAANKEVSIDVDYISGVSRVDVDVEFEIKGTVAERNNKIDTWLNSNTVRAFALNIASIEYGSAGGGVISNNLNPEPVSFRTTHNRSKGSLSLSATYDDEEFITGFTSGSWDMTIKTPVPYTKASPSVSATKVGAKGFWSIQSFNHCTRKKITTNASYSAREDSTTNDDGTSGDRAQAAKAQAALAAGFMITNYDFDSAGTSHYVVSKNESVLDGPVSTGTHSQEISRSSYPDVGNSPLIDINLAKQLT